MENLRVVIVEDELIIAEDLRQTLEAEGYVIAGCFDSAEESLEKIGALQPDLVMIDIRLKGPMTGIDLASRLRNMLSVPFIFVTASSDEKTYRLAKSTSPQAFLVKPFNSRSLLAAVDLALDNFVAERSDQAGKISAADRLASQATASDSLFIRVNGKHKKIKLSEFLFVEANGSYINIVTTSGRYTLSYNLRDFQRKLPVPGLVRVHRSYVVNVARIDSFDDGFVYVDQNQIPLGKSYRHDFHAILNAI